MYLRVKNVTDTIYYPNNADTTSNQITSYLADDTIVRSADIQLSLFVPGDFNGKDINPQIYVNDGNVDDVDVYTTVVLIGRHTHNPVFGISEIASACSDITISIDDGQGYEDKTSTIEGATMLNRELHNGDGDSGQEQNINIIDLIGRETGWKGIKISPTGKCRIKGMVIPQVFIQSKT